MVISSFDVFEIRGLSEMTSNILCLTHLSSFYSDQCEPRSGMQKAMTNRAVCADGEQSRYKYIAESTLGKVKRTRKAPDFYSPEVPK